MLSLSPLCCRPWEGLCSPSPLFLLGAQPNLRYLISPAWFAFAARKDMSTRLSPYGLRPEATSNWRSWEVKFWIGIKIGKTSPPSAGYALFQTSVNISWQEALRAGLSLEKETHFSLKASSSTLVSLVELAFSSDHIALRSIVLSQFTESTSIPNSSRRHFSTRLVLFV